MLRNRTHFRGFTITEILVAVGTIIVLLAILLPALNTVRTQAGMADSQNNLRQCGTWLRLYATDNREYICPTQFDYSGDPYPGHVRSAATVQLGTPNQGTWTDILWTVYGNYSYPQISSANAVGGGIVGHDYSTDSPDYDFYSFYPDHSGNPFRSARLNTKSPDGGTAATPFGVGARSDERGMPGYFAGNNYFNAAAASGTFNGWFVTGQIKAPSRSLYAVDSFYGETIEDDPVAWNMDGGTGQVDFRYADACLMLMLDGSVSPEGLFNDLNALEQDRRIRVRNLIN